MDAIARVKGTTGIIIVYNDRILISRKSFGGYMAQGDAGDRTYYFTDITAVEFKKPSFWANGYLKIIASGTNDVNSSVNRLGWTRTKSLHDANTVKLRALKKETTIQAQLVYDAIMTKLLEVKISKNITGTNIDQLLKLAELRKDGMLTEEEFESEKKKLLN